MAKWDMLEITRPEWGGLLCGISGLCLGIGIPAYLLWKAYFWLRFGAWPDYPISLALGPSLHLQWAGLQKIADWWWTTDIGWTALAASGVALWYGVHLQEHPNG